jgi:hypothetical protein
MSAAADWIWAFIGFHRSGQNGNRDVAAFDPASGSSALRVDASCKHSSAANGVDDFDSIAIPDFALRVLALRHDFAVDFDCHATLSVAGFIKQIAQRATWRAVARLAIQNDRVHDRILDPSSVCAKFRSRIKNAPG